MQASQDAPSDRKRVPLWHRIEGVLRHKIARGEYRTGEMLPSEPALAASFGVSRMTVREAIRSLTTDGLVRQVQGKGTFVCGKAETDLRSSMTTSFMGNIRYNEAFPATSPDPIHRTPVCSHIDIATVEAPADVRRLLQLDEPTITRVERVLAGPVDVGYVLDYIPHAIGDRISRDDLAAAWLTEVLTKRLGIPVVEARQTIEATLADVVLSEKLNIPFGSPLLYAERVYYGEADRPLYLAKVWHRADRFRYTAVFRFEGSEPADGTNKDEQVGGGDARAVGAT